MKILIENMFACLKEKFFLVTMLTVASLGQSALGVGDRQFIRIDIDYGAPMQSAPINSRLGGFLNEGESATISKLQLVECGTVNPSECWVHQLDPKDLDWSFEGMGDEGIVWNNWLCIDGGLSYNEKLKAGLVSCPGTKGYLFSFLGKSGSSSSGKLVSYDTTGPLGSKETLGVRVVAKVADRTPGLSRYKDAYGEFFIKFRNRFDVALDTNGKVFGSSPVMMEVKFREKNKWVSAGNGTRYVNSCRAQGSNGQTVRFYEDKKVVIAAKSLSRIKLYGPDVAAMASGEKLEVSCAVSDTRDGFQRIITYTEQKP